MRRLLAFVLVAVLAGALAGALAGTLGPRLPAVGAQPQGQGSHAAAVAPGAAARAVGPAQAGPGTSAEPADDPDGDSSTDDAPVPGGDIIPQPNSGHEPTEAGDRGGALQGLVFVLILVGLGTILAMAVRESRKARCRAAAAADGGAHDGDGAPRAGQPRGA